MKITRTSDNAVILDGNGEFTLTHHPHQFEFDKSMLEKAEPHVTLQHFRSHYICSKHWRCRLKVTIAALKYIWLKK